MQSEYGRMGQERGSVSAFALSWVIVLASAYLCFGQVQPAIVAASGTSSMEQVIVDFAAPVDVDIAQDPANYIIQSAYSQLPVLSARLRADRKQAMLTTGPQLEGVVYEVRFGDTAGDKYLTRTAADAAATFEAFVFTPGLVQFEVFDLSDQDIEDLSLNPLLIDPDFPDNPREVHYIRSLDTTYAYPDRRHDQYGSRIRGLFVPPTSGNYIFYLRSDDASQVWFNPAGTSESGKIKILEETECCHAYSANASDPIPLVGGERYYLEVLHREGPEYDYCQVAAKRDDDPTNPDYLFPISYKSLGMFADPNGVQITSDPAHNAIALLPPGAVNPLLLSEDFQNDDGGFTLDPGDSTDGRWTYNPDRGGVWMAKGQGLLCDPLPSPEVTVLNSPPVAVPNDDPVFVIFQHRYSFQYNEGNNYDGGQLRLSVNGGSYQTVPAGNFEANGYTGVITGNNLLTGQEAFTATLRGHQSGYYSTSVALLGSFKTGDTISVQFMGAWNECINEDDPDWEISAVWITQSLTQVTVNAAGTLPDVGSVPVAHTWQIDTGSGFVDYGSIEESLWLAPSFRDDGTRFRAFLALPGMSFYSEPVTLRLTREPTCSIGGPYVADCATGQAGLTVQLDASESADPDGGTVTYAWSTACPGATFDNPAGASPTLTFAGNMGPLDSCEVSLTVTDSIGAAVTCSTVVDTSRSTIPPTIALNGGDQTFTCNSGANQYVELGATAIDACGRPVSVTIGPPADTRRKGTQTVTYDAVDAFGNAAQQLTRTVTVEEPPVQLTNVPGNLVAECTVPGGISRSSPTISMFLNAPVAVDNCDPDEQVINDAPSLLPIGQTLVTWEVIDNGAPGPSASAMVTVQDTTAPAVTCTPIELEADGSGTVVLPDLRSQISASDACTAASELTVAQDPPPGTVLGIGTYDITFTVTDAAASPLTTTCSTTLDVTAVAGETPVAPGCGAAGCGGAGLMSWMAMLLGLMGVKLIVGRRRE